MNNNKSYLPQQNSNHIYNNYILPYHNPNNIHNKASYLNKSYLPQCNSNHIYNNYIIPQQNSNHVLSNDTYTYSYYTHNNKSYLPQCNSNYITQIHSKALYMGHQLQEQCNILYKSYLPQCNSNVYASLQDTIRLYSRVLPQPLYFQSRRARGCLDNYRALSIIQPVQRLYGMHIVLENEGLYIFSRVRQEGVQIILSPILVIQLINN